MCNLALGFTHFTPCPCEGIQRNLRTPSPIPWNVLPLWNVIFIMSADTVLLLWIYSVVSFLSFSYNSTFSQKFHVLLLRGNKRVWRETSTHCVERSWSAFQHCLEIWRSAAETLSSCKNLFNLVITIIDGRSYNRSALPRCLWLSLLWSLLLLLLSFLFIYLFIFIIIIRCYYTWRD